MNNTGTQNRTAPITAREETLVAYRIRTILGYTLRMEAARSRESDSASSPARVSPSVPMSSRIFTVYLTEEELLAVIDALMTSYGRIKEGQE